MSFGVEIIPVRCRTIERIASSTQLARSSGLRLNGMMRGRAVLVLLGLTAFGAYSVGRQSAPVSNAPVPTFDQHAINVSAASGLYPPDLQDAAVQNVLQQAEALSAA